MFNNHQFLHLLSSLKWEQSLDAIVNNFYSLLISTMETCEGVKHKNIAESKAKSPSFPINRWFDECKIQKRIVNIAAKKLISDPTCVQTREHYWREKKVYKTLTKQKKRRALHLQLSTLKTSHPREFWNIVSKLTGVNQKRIPISITDMASHFRELNTNTTVPLVH